MPTYRIGDLRNSQAYRKLLSSFSAACLQKSVKIFSSCGSAVERLYNGMDRCPIRRLHAKVLGKKRWIVLLLSPVRVSPLRVFECSPGNPTGADGCHRFRLRSRSTPFRSGSFSNKETVPHSFRSFAECSMIVRVCKCCM